MIAFIHRTGLIICTPGKLTMAAVHKFIPVGMAEGQLVLDLCHTVSCGRHVSTYTGGSLSDALRSDWVRVSPKRYVDVGPSEGVSLSRRKGAVEKLWQEFLKDPSEWWDNRAEKTNSRYPDFKHKTTGQSLWLDNNLTPPWVEAKLDAITAGTLQSDIFSWNLRLQKYAKAGDYKNTMETFQQLLEEGMKPNKFTFAPILNACAHLGMVEEGKRIHSKIIQAGYESDLYVASCLVDMYAKCGSIEDAWKVFSKMPSRNVISWNAMILGYVKCGQARKALKLSGQMYQEGVQPSPVTFIGMLNACASVAALEEGRFVHEQISRKGYESDVFVASSLVDMYSKCGRVEDAQTVFDKMPLHTVVSWNALILGYVKYGDGQKALALYRHMYEEGVEPSPVTFVGVLNACASEFALEEGRLVHKQISMRGYESDVFVASSLVDMYAKCGRIEDAQRVFNKMPSRDVVSWNAMILGYVKCGEAQKALGLSRQMLQEGVEQSSVTFVGLLNACANVAALKEGRLIHEQISGKGYESDVFVASSLIDMYAKCGSIEDAKRVFDKMPRRDVVSWNAMLASYAMHGRAKEALGHFERMCQAEVEVDDVTLGCLLWACTHGGLAEEGLSYFESMSEVYNLSPTMEHNACVVDLLGRAGRLHQADDLIRCMPCEVDATVWMSLLGACRTHGNVEMGQCVAKRILELEPGSASGHLLLSNICSAAYRRDSGAILNGSNVSKQPEHAWIEVNNYVHPFPVNDDRHPQKGEIHAELERLSGQMVEAGYVPDITSVSHDVDEEPKESHFCLLSKKLVIGFGSYQLTSLYTTPHLKDMESV